MIARSGRERGRRARQRRPHWNLVWDVRTSIGPEGWYVEFRIPFSQLRFSP